MSPEQARGKALDKRSDIWSFGLVLFEMLTGKSMFAGKSFAETLAAVIHQEPSLEELPNDTPWKIRELLERCLRKDPRMRLRDLGDARVVIHESLTGTPDTGGNELVPPPTRPLLLCLAPWALVPLLVVAAWAIRPDHALPERPVLRFQVQVAGDEALFNGFRHGVAISPDGKRLAFVAKVPGPEQDWTIYLRSLDQLNSGRLTLEGGVGNPFFSPDGKWLGFYSISGQKLMKVGVEGGTPTTILDLRETVHTDVSHQRSSQLWPYGLSWGTNDTIVFAPEIRGGLWRVSASGGEPEQITEPDQEKGEVSHRLPHLLPGGEAVIYTVFLHTSHAKGTEQIVVQDLESGERRILLENGTDGRYVPTGHLVFAREGTLMAAPFDLGDLVVTGPWVPVVEGIGHCIFTGGDVRESGAAQFSFSASGSLAYIPGSVFPERKGEVVWQDRSGKVELTEIPPASYYHVRLSPDGSKVLLGRGYKEPNIWKYDFVRGTLTNQTAEGSGLWPEWTPDGMGFVYTSGDLGFPNLFRKPIDSSEAPERLTADEYQHVIGSWHPDGDRFVFLQKDPGTGVNRSIWLLSTQGSSLPKPLVKTPFTEFDPDFSPNGRWLAYASAKSNRLDVYVQPYPGLEREIPISPGGGYAPAWSPSGKELFYCSGGREPKMMAVEITYQGDDLTVGNPVVLFTRGSGCSSGPVRKYDVSRDGQRFLRIRKDRSSSLAMEQKFFGNKVNVVLNWSEELRRLAPTE